MLEFLQARAIGGIEIIEEGSYSRTFFDAGEQGIVKVSHDPRRNSLVVAVHSPSKPALFAIVQRVRRIFDLDADLEAISTHLAKDPLLAPLLTARPGLRVPGGWDGFELAIRAILGQQITVTAARQLATALVKLCGQPIPHSAQTVAGLNHTFPTPERVLAADLRLLGIPTSRKQALLSLAEAARRDSFLFQPVDTIENTVMRLRQIRGIGEWTAHYIALRGLRQPDAFPASDVGLLRAIAKLSGVMRPTPDHLISLAEAWRPWRAYAAQHLWAVNKLRIANETTL
jgi:AraC family transcriptional regulator of adaptative response / DNA-3-methyladenine glycosylase II